MGDLKPLGSEKLQGSDKLKRILELTYYKEPKKSTNYNKPEVVKESTNGGVFGIVKEKDGYYVKRGVNESTLDYIGGLFMKNKNKFSSYAEALKRMELLVGQENLQEATKYVLKQKKAENEAPISEPTMPTPDTDVPSIDDTSSLPPSDQSMGDVDTTTPPEGDGQSKRSDYMAEVQKYAGKLGQELRDQQERMESDDIKYVLNMIISAVDLDKLDIDDLDEIGKKFEREDDEDFSGEELPTDDQIPSDDEQSSEVPPTDEELGEVDGLTSLESFVNSDAPKQENEINLSKYSELGLGEEEDIKEFDLDEIKDEINTRVGETLSKYFK